MPVIKKLNMVKYTEELARLTVMMTGAEIRNEARKLVRLDSKTLRNSIRFDMLGRANGEVSANTPYAAAQEWGLAPFGKPNYGFTPYMRPAATEVVNTKMDGIVERAEAGARSRAAV